MIVRIMGDKQYKMDSCFLDDMNAIDNQIVNHVGKGDAEAYARDLSRLISLVKAHGEPLDAEHITISDVLVPPEDLSIEEARRVFSGEGIIKG
ncbi:MAG TPA: hypothetical protein VN455_04675 [Methanotrichaceae archaeon]|nr:hypothetical protein [Methanotrichaceae archaeon]